MDSELSLYCVFESGDHQNQFKDYGEESKGFKKVNIHSCILKVLYKNAE